MKYHPLTSRIQSFLRDGKTPKYKVLDKIIREWLKDRIRILDGKLEDGDITTEKEIMNHFELTTEQSLEDKFKEAVGEQNVNENRFMVQTLIKVATEHFNQPKLPEKQV